MDRPSIKPVDIFSRKEILRSIASPHVVILFIMFFMVGTMLFGLALFLPSIVNQLGFSPNRTQLLSVGPFAAGFFGKVFFVLFPKCDKVSKAVFCFFLVILLSTYLSDRYESRGIATALASMLSVAGFSLYLGNDLTA